MCISAAFFWIVLSIDRRLMAFIFGHTVVAESQLHEAFDCQLTEPFAAWFDMHVHIARYKEVPFGINIISYLAGSAFFGHGWGWREKGVSRVVFFLKIWTFKSSLRTKITETQFRFQSFSWFSNSLWFGFRCFLFGFRFSNKRLLRSQPLFTLIPGNAIPMFDFDVYLYIRWFGFCLFVLNLNLSLRGREQ